ncbi:hemagglutinin repeat-containing protein, partial [Klebsiella pneumoniae]
SQDTQQTTGSNKSSGGSIGVGIGAGAGGAGISISANASSSKGHESGNGTWQNETTVDAGHQVIISSGRDTTLAGAQVSGHQVTADVGRDLTITSLRDSDHYDSTQSSLSGGLGYTFGAGSWSGSLNASRDKMTSDWSSVQEQSGIFAGQGGFDVSVGSHTQLNGGVIAATGSADKNSLNTGTLGFSDIHNQADYKTQHQGGGISTGGSIGSQFAGNMTSALLAGGGSKGHAEGTTQSAVSEGTITIRDRENQKQDVADLSRDAEHASGSIGPIFDKEKEQRRLQEVQLTGEIGSQAADIARTQGEIAKQKAIKDPAALTAAEAKLKAEGNSSPTAEQIADQAGRTAMAAYGTGSDLQRGIQAATAALQGLAGGDIAGALAGASAPELANLIGHGSGLSDGAAVVAHAILGGAVAALQGNSAAAGAAGAAAGELAAKAIAGMLYPGVTDLSTLTEAQKQTVSTLATISAGMAGGLAGNSTASAVAGAQAGKNAAENNALSDIAEQLASGQSPADKLDKLNKAEEERFRREECAGLSSDACGAKMYDQRREALKDMASLGADFLPIVGDIKGFAEAESAIDYLAAVIGIFPGLGDGAGKAIKAAETALKKGDVAEASKLINKASDEVSATLPMGSRYNQMNQPKNPSYQPVRNQPATISNREYSGHALDRMQDRGITPSVIENVIKNGKSTPSRNGTTVHFDPKNKVS